MAAVAPEAALRSSALRAAAVGVLLACFFHASSAAERRYPLPERGFLTMDVPAGWRDQLRQPSRSMPPTIALRAGKGRRFEVLVTPMWPAERDAPAPTRKSIRRQVALAADGIRTQSAEPDLRLVKFAGAVGLGYYFSATDRAPNPRGYKFMTDGIVKVGDLALRFTILTNDGQGQVTRDALAMVKSAVYVHAGTALARK